MPKTVPSTDGTKMTIYELTEEERAVMKKLIDNGLVVTIGEHARVKARYQWAANELLACDYGDNDAGPGIVGWLVYGWRDKKPRQHHEHRRIFGKCIDEAIDAEQP
jgi:hypothetical protein